MQRESSVQTSVLDYLNSLGGCIAENISGTASQSGRADVNACCHGRAIKLELKRMSGDYRVTRKQLFELYKWQKAGAAVGVAYSLEDVKRFIQYLLSGEKGFVLYERPHRKSAFFVTDRRDEFVKALLDNYDKEDSLL